MSTIDKTTKNCIIKAVRYYCNAPKNSYINVIDKGDHFYIWYQQTAHDRSDDREIVHLSMKIDMLPRTTEIV